MENKLLYARTARCCMASHMEWHLDEVDWLRLLLFENEVENITKTASYMKAFIKPFPFFIPLQQILAAQY